MSRTRGLDALEPFVFGETQLLAGDLVVVAGHKWLYGWPVTGGASRRLARLPDLGPRSRDDFASLIGDGAQRVDAAEAGRVAIVRHTIQRGPTDIARNRGPQLAVGPPEGPFAKVRGCGEIAGTPATLDGRWLAYRARPGGCVAHQAIVVRDADGALRRVVDLPARERGVDQIALRGDYLAYDTGNGRFSEAGTMVIVVDLNTGARRTVLRKGSWVWTLGDGGVLYALPVDPGARGLCAGGPLRRYALGDVEGTAVAAACGNGLLDEVGGEVRFTERAPDRRFVLRTPTRTLATTSFLALDGDADHVIAGDDDCRSDALRVMDLTHAPIPPAGPRRCPISVAVRPRARADGQLRVRLRCPRGCRAGVAAGRGVGRHSRLVRVHGRRVVRLPVGDGAGRVRVVVTALDPVGRRRFVRFVRVTRGR